MTNIICIHFHFLLPKAYIQNWVKNGPVGSEKSKLRANLSAVVYLSLCGFCLERFPLPLGAWDGLRYFIVALPEPSI